MGHQSRDQLDMRMWRISWISSTRKPIGIHIRPPSKIPILEIHHRAYKLCFIREWTCRDFVIPRINNKEVLELRGIGSPQPRGIDPNKITKASYMLIRRNRDCRPELAYTSERPTSRENLDRQIQSMVPRTCPSEAYHLWNQGPDPLDQPTSKSFG